MKKLVPILILGLSIHAARSEQGPYAPEMVGVVPDGSQIGLYDYDTAGNRLFNSANGQTIEIGLIGKAVSIEQSGVTSSIKHGLDGRRYLRADSDGIKTFYLAGMERKIDTDGNVTRNVRINAKGYSPVAQVEISDNVTEYSYLIQDHLGSYRSTIWVSRRRVIVMTLGGS